MQARKAHPNNGIYDIGTSVSLNDVDIYSHVSDPFCYLLFCLATCLFNSVSIFISPFLRLLIYALVVGGVFCVSVLFHIDFVPELRCSNFDICVVDVSVSIVRLC